MMKSTKLERYLTAFIIFLIISLCFPCAKWNSSDYHSRPICSDLPIKFVLQKQCITSCITSILNKQISLIELLGFSVQFTNTC